MTLPTLQPITRASLSDQVFDQLSAEIVAGHFEPGTPLPSERALCAALQVNRGAIREAVKRLAQAGLVDSQHGSGHQVLDYRRSAGLDLLPRLLFRPDGDVDLLVVRSVMEMRVVVGPDAAALCALRASEGVRAQLHASVSAMERVSDDTAALQDLAIELWHQLVDGSENIAYRLAYNALSGVYEQVRPALIEVLGDEIRDVAGCRAMVAAIAARDADAARAAAQAVIARGTDALNAAMALLDG